MVDGHKSAGKNKIKYNYDYGTPKAPHNLFKAVSSEGLYIYFTRKKKTFMAFITFKNYLFHSANR